MDIPNRFLSVSSPRKFVGLLTLTLLLINAYSVKAQDATPTATATATATPRATPTATPSPTPTPTPTPVSAEDSRQNKLVDSIWFPTVIILMFGIVLIGFAYTITRAIRFSKETFRSKSGLPEGSLRAMLAFMLVALLGFYVLASILSFSPSFRPPDFLLGIVATVIGFYFGSRTSEERSAAPTTGSVLGDVTDKNGTPAVGASVELSQPGGKKLTQPSDANGKYKFDNVPIGDYDIQASLTGNVPSDSAKVKVTAGGSQTVKLKLK